MPGGRSVIRSAALVVPRFLGVALVEAGFMRHTQRSGAEFTRTLSGR